MFKNLKIKALAFLIVIATSLSCGSLSAAQKNGSFPKTSSSKSYTKKSPYSGYGKTSKVNGLPKAKIISGHAKKTSKGYTYVNPYARSK